MSEFTDRFKYAGLCVVDGRKVYREFDGHDPDPRGELGINRSACTLVASEFGMVGEDILLCYACAQERNRYDAGVAHAKAIWKEKSLTIQST